MVLWLALLGGCGFNDRVRCESDDQVLAEANGEQLACSEAEPALRYIRLLSARPLARNEALALAGVRDLFEKDPAGTREWLDDFETWRAPMVAETGFEGAEARAHAVWQHVNDKGPIKKDSGRLRSAADTAIAIWNTHDGDELALTEADIEAWIRYGSLCRQMQGAGTLRISVADRVQVYNTIAERWKHGSKLDRVALAALGPYWLHAADNFEAASYEKQQAWAKAAPLPPPMTSTSLGYIQVILEGDLVAHATAVHSKLGPLRMAK